MEELTTSTPCPCTCRIDVPDKTGNRTLTAKNGDPSAAAGSAEAEEVIGVHGKVMEGGQQNARGNSTSSADVEPGNPATAAANDVAVYPYNGMGNNSPVPAKASAAIKPPDPDAPSSPVDSKTPAAVARGFASPVRRMISGTVYISKLIITPARAVFAVLTLLALWSAADNPRRAVWTFSLIAISYTTLWTIWLTAAILARTVLVSVSYVALLAISVTHLSSSAGIFVLLLDTAYSAGLCGYALSEYRQRKGFERRAADEARLCTRCSKEEELNKVDDRAVTAMLFFYSTVTSMACTAGAAWVIFYAVDTYWVVVVLSLLIDLSLFFWTAVVGVHLVHGALLAADCILFIYWGVGLLIVPDILLSYLFRDAIGMLVHLLGVMGVAGLLGYNLGLYEHYKQMLEGDDGKSKKLA